MELINDFTIAASADEAWPVLTDLSRVVPCLPGASLDSVDTNTFTGGMKIKLGPMSLSYKGEGKISPDHVARSIVVEATGGEQRGGGSAAATITAVLEPLDVSRTRVRVTTDLDLSGKPAQFGRGIMVDVAGRILGTFASNLERELQAAPMEEKVPAPGSSSEPLDLGAAGLLPVLKRVVPVLVGSVVVGLVVRRLARRPRR
ncbi:MAG TPA: SRPBCC family protein [Marmoricola sp.]|jgi:carbon monoxide dehydrogenase subunit G|nr:SRPBCC family protein [Marmoricola sp.]